LRQQLTPVNPDHQKNAVIEIVPGVGGDESCLFVQILFDIYSRYSRQQGWDLEELDLQHGNQGGFKYLAFVVKGRGAYGKLRFESGTHKIQRISPTDSAKRMHTSAATVIVFPEIEDVEITINKADVRVDKFRSQGPGGQNVNKVETGIRLTHIPTNIVVRCEGRSQHQNLMRAWQILNSRVTSFFAEKIALEQAQQRKEIVGTGDRSQRVRTYNYPQNRVTDFRGPITVTLESILSGQLQLIIDQLMVTASS